MIITFIGHADVIISEKTKKEIKNYLTNVILDRDDILFYCGGYGCFDSFCAALCQELKQINRFIKVVFITPYITLEYQKRIKDVIESGNYDYSLYPPIEKTPYRFAISKRNEWMINESDLIVAYVKRTYGGAYKSILYARRKKKQIMNFADCNSV